MESSKPDIFMSSNLHSLLQNIFEKNSLIHVVISATRNKSQLSQKITIRPTRIKQSLQFQITSFQGQKTFHNNVSPEECLALIESYLESQFKQCLLCTNEADYHILINKKGEATILKKSPTHSLKPLMHNREKNYLLQEGLPIPFLVELGVMAKDGKVLAKKSDKFKQLNRFLEFIDDVLPHLDKNKTLHIIDFGCGKAYLTFALYHYLAIMKGFQLDIQGLDLKEDVISFCQNLSEKLNFNGLKFTLGDIKNYKPQGKIDLVIALHACDIATDIAIAQAVAWDSEVIMCVPCCQKELFKQVKNDALTPLIKHGILKERFSALATDAARAQLLEIAGYNAQVLEFIDMEHTPKNLLIRAIKTSKGKNRHEKALAEYDAFTKMLNISPYLEKHLLPK
jgi:SAM-dependent methyltransferase